MRKTCKCIERQIMIYRQINTVKLKNNSVYFISQLDLLNLFILYFGEQENALSCCFFPLSPKNTNISIAILRTEPP